MGVEFWNPVYFLPLQRTFFGILVGRNERNDPVPGCYLQVFGSWYKCDKLMLY
jgi:hypothetical protein